MKKAIFSMKAFYISLFVVLFFPLGLMGQDEATTLQSNSSYFYTIKDGEYLMTAKNATALGAVTELEGDNLIWQVVTNNRNNYLQNVKYKSYLKYDAGTNVYTLVTDISAATPINTNNNQWYLGTKTETETITAELEGKVQKSVERWFFGTHYEWQDQSESKIGNSSLNSSYTCYVRPCHDEANDRWIGCASEASYKDAVAKNFSLTVDGISTSSASPSAKNQYRINPSSLKFTNNNNPNPPKIIEKCVNTATKAHLYKINSIAHQKGASASSKEYGKPIEGLQPVHTYTEVIYAKPYAASNSYVHLRLPVEDVGSYVVKFDIGNIIGGLIGGNFSDLVNYYLQMFVKDKYLNGFYRWFKYDEANAEAEKDVSIINSSLRHTKASGQNEVTFDYIKTDKGDVILKNQSPGKTSFKMGTERVKIACDISNFSDYKPIFSNSEFKLLEPTLSYRVIYDIRPASEIAAKMSSTPLEVYNITAPASTDVKIGPKYRCSGDETCYFYDNKNNNPIAMIKTPKLVKYNSNGNVINETALSANQFDDGRLFTIKAPGIGSTDIYKLFSNDKQVVIAEFRVSGCDINKTGPLVTTDSIPFPESEATKYLTLIDNRTFDYDSKDLFDTPLSWNDISYGFVYYPCSGTGTGSPNDIVNSTRMRKGYGGSNILPHWSEYSFILGTSTLSDDSPIFKNIESHSKPKGKNCRFLYCSGTSKPSMVADFLINGDLCPASKVFLSAWVVPTYDIDKVENKDFFEEFGNAVYPNLSLSVIGVRDGEEYVISTFLTGNIVADPDNPGKWHHILFEFETTQDVYDEYHIRIENNNASVFNIGNEFGLDDIRVWTTTKTAATVNQIMSCPTWDVNKPTVIGKSNIALIKADLTNTPSSDTKIYYSWLKMEGVDDDIVHLGLDNYIGGQSSSSLYGVIDVNKTWNNDQIPDDKLVESVDKYIEDHSVAIENLQDLTDNKFVDYFFTREKENLVLYIIHKDEKFQLNEKYYSMVTTIDLKKYNTTDKLIGLYENLQCGNIGYFEVLPYSRAFLTNEDGEKYDYDFTETVIKHLAEGKTYNFVVEAYSPGNVDDGEEPIVSYNCTADWLLVNGMDEAEKWTNVKRIIDWRNPVMGAAEPADLDDKLTKGVISKEITMSETEPFMHYVVIPCPGSTEDEEGPCVVPFELLLYDSIPATLADPEVSEATDTWKYDRPAAICNEPIIVRIPNSLEGEGNISLNLNIDYFDEYLFAEIAKYNAQEGNKNPYPLSEIYLYDANGQAHKSNITAKDENNQTLTLDLLNKDDVVTISGGHTFVSGQKYHFAGLNEVNGVTITPPFQFDVYVVPDEVVWTGDEDKSTAWHKDANWNPAFIPMSHTNVVIPGNTTNKPVLKPSATEFEAGAYEWLEHDIVLTKNEGNVLVDNTSAVLNSCKDIYFDAGAQLANQHMLNYERAFVDVPFTGTNFGKSNKNFKIMSFPLRNVYRGDLYIPRNYDENTKEDIGDGDFDFPQIGAQFEAMPVNNRAYNSFYVKAYDSAIKQNHVVNNNGKNEVDYSNEYNYENTSWSNPTSVLNFEFEEVHGYAVSLNANTAQSFVRLPKSATEYYLFMNFGNGNEKELHGSTWPEYEIPKLQLKDDKRIRSSEGHKLVYDKSHGASVTFTNKVGNIFLIGNPFMTGLDVKAFLENEENKNSLEHKFYYQYDDKGSIDAKMVDHHDTCTCVIPPFGAMFVKGNAKTQTFKFTPAMMSYKQSPEPPTQQRAPRMVEERELLTITAEVDGARSRTYIEKDFAANNEYLDTEDADLLVLDADLTPISVYSVATGAALAYNSVTDMEFVPLGLLLVDSTIVAESVRFTFDGVDYFYDELYLYDALYNSYLPLIDGVALELEMPESGELRYFITDTKHNVGGGVATSDDLVEGSKVCVFTTEGEACIIAEDIISEATVYDIAGRLIYYSDQISSSQHNISLPNGVYMLKVVVNSNLSTHKIILK